MNRKIKLTAAALVAASALSLCSFKSGAATDRFYEAESQNYSTGAHAFDRYELSVSKIYNKNKDAYSKLKLTFNGKVLASDTRMINGMPYVCVNSLINEATDMKATYTSAKTLNVKGRSFEMDVIDGSNVIYANGRTLLLSNRPSRNTISCASAWLSLDRIFVSLSGA